MSLNHTPLLPESQQPLRLNHVPDSQRYILLSEIVAMGVCRSVQSPKNWIVNEWLTPYRDADGNIRVNLAELEHALASNPRMRDQRKPFGEDIEVKPVPIVGQVIGSQQ